MQYQAGFNVSGLKFRYQEVTNIATSGTNASLENGNYIKASINTSNNYGVLNLPNPKFIRRGTVCIIEYDQVLSSSSYKPLIITARVRSGYHTYTRQSKSIGLLPGEAIMIVQRTDTDTTPYWSVLGLSTNNLVESFRNLPIDQSWYNIATVGTTVTEVLESMVGISPYNVNTETTGINAELWYPVYMSDYVNYDFYLTGKLGADKGQVIVYEGANAVGALASYGDFYDASLTDWVTKKLTNAAYYIPSYCGNHIIRIKVASKNASSSDYNTKLAKLYIKPAVNLFIS